MATKLLLIEDNLTIQKIIEGLFRQEAYEVVVASNATEGLEKLHAFLPDIVLTDASLPGLDGFQLCQIVRETATLQHIPVVLLTSNFATYDPQKAERFGVTERIDKPFDPQALFSLVKQLAATTASEPVLLPAAQPVVPLPATPTEQPWEMMELGQDDLPPEAEALLSKPDIDVLPPSRHEKGMVQMHNSPPNRGNTSEAISGTWESSATPPSAEALPPDILLQAVGRSLLQSIQQTSGTHLAAMLEALTPQILDIVREVVTAKMPEILERLLQQEIDKLKQAAEQQASTHVSC